ncbi:uncharacterized protein LOC110621560 [Manihot esculenta]|uniref:uncharacterized protein LOC110621560 n=1 Tax=Manihot esculenta TaxID=3983 RepID=UPI000B5D1C0B|nr:uncharacterized protein LOC110621560 [Manihot esculenta]
MRDRIKYCQFHEDHGHTMEEFVQLKDEIERLIRDDILQKFARKDREKRRLEPEIRTPENTVDSEPVVVIHVIVGGPNDGKGKNKRTIQDVLSIEQEIWTKQEIKFGPIDKVTELFHNDSLVISVRLNMYDVSLFLFYSFYFDIMEGEVMEDRDALSVEMAGLLVDGGGQMGLEYQQEELGA